MISVTAYCRIALGRARAGSVGAFSIWAASAVASASPPLARVPLSPKSRHATAGRGRERCASGKAASSIGSTRLEPFSTLVNGPGPDGLQQLRRVGHDVRGASCASGHILLLEGLGSTSVDVGTLLRSLGLERYEQAFRDNEIAAEVLPELTDADLRELGLPLA